MDRQSIIKTSIITQLNNLIENVTGADAVDGFKYNIQDNTEKGDLGCVTDIHYSVSVSLKSTT